MDHPINLTKAMDALWAKKWLVALAAVLFLLPGLLLVDIHAPDIYTATASIYAASYASYSDSVEGMNVMRDYVDVIHSRKVAERAAAHMAQGVSAEDIMNMASASYAASSHIVTIEAASPEPTLAVLAANAVAEAFIREIEGITAVDSVRVLDSAHEAVRTTDGRREAALTLAGIALLGALLAAGLISAAAALDTRVAFPAEVTLGGKIELLGTIPDRRL